MESTVGSTLKEHNGGTRGKTRLTVRIFNQIHPQILPL